MLQNGRFLKTSYYGYWGQKKLKKEGLVIFLVANLSSPQMALTCKMGSTKAAPRTLAITTASTIWFLCWFIPPETTTIRYLVLSSTTPGVDLRYSWLKLKQGTYPKPSGCFQNSSSLSSNFSTFFSLDPTIPRCGIASSRCCSSGEIEHGFGSSEKGVSGSTLKPSLSIPKRPQKKKMRREKKQRRRLLGFFMEKKEEEDLGWFLDDGLLGDRRRESREEQDKVELMIVWDGTEMYESFMEFFDFVMVLMTVAMLQIVGWFFRRVASHSLSLYKHIFGFCYMIRLQLLLGSEKERKEWGKKNGERREGEKEHEVDWRTIYGSIHVTDGRVRPGKLIFNIFFKKVLVDKSMSYLAKF